MWKCWHHPRSVSFLGSARASRAHFRRLAEMLLLFNQNGSLARRQRQHARRVRSPDLNRDTHDQTGPFKVEDFAKHVLLTSVAQLRPPSPDICVF
jgi:hypothetical protein